VYDRIQDIVSSLDQSKSGPVCLGITFSYQRLPPWRPRPAAGAHGRCQSIPGPL
jgi:hypothetical protein